MNAWESFIHTHLPVEGVRKWIEARDEKRAEAAEFEATFSPEAVAKRALEQDDPAIKAMYDVGKPVTLATPMVQIPPGASMPHNNHLIESSEPTSEQAAAASWQRDMGEGYMQETAEAAYNREIKYHAWEDMDADMDRKEQEIEEALNPGHRDVTPSHQIESNDNLSRFNPVRIEQQLNRDWRNAPEPEANRISARDQAERAAFEAARQSHPIDHLRGNGHSAEKALAEPTLSDEGKGQPDLFSSRVLSYPPESRGPSGYKPTESAQYQAEQTFYGKYSPTMSQQQRDAGRVATAERQDAQSGLFGTMERQQEKEL